MTKTLDIHGPFQCFGFRMQLVFEMRGHGGQGIMTGLEGLVKTQNVTPVGLSAFATGGGTFHAEIETAYLLKVMFLHGRMTLVGLVHSIEVLGVVFVHARFSTQEVAEKLFHEGDFSAVALVRETVLEGGNEFHGEVSVLGSHIFEGVRYAHQ